MHSPATVLVPPVPWHTAGPVVGGCRGKDKSYFDNVSLIDSDPFQVSSRFPDLLMEPALLLLHKLTGQEPAAKGMIMLDKHRNQHKKGD